MVQNRYLLTHRVAIDPFTSLHESVGELVKNAMGEIESENPRASFVVCGSPAVSMASIRRFFCPGKVRFSAEPSSLSDCSLRLNRHVVSIDGGRVIGASSCHRFTSRLLYEAVLAVQIADYSTARLIALAWVQKYEAMKLPGQLNWKIIKKSLISKVFGRSLCYAWVVRNYGG